MQAILKTLLAPNNLLINLFLLPCSIFEVFYTLKIALLIFNTDISKKQKIYYMICFSTFYSIFIFLLPTNVKAILSTIVAFLLISFIFKGNKTKSLIVVILSWASLALSEACAITLIKLIWQTDVVKIANIPLFRIPFQLFIYSFFILFYLIVKKVLSNKSSILDSLPKKTKILLSLTAISGITALIPALFFIIYDIDTKSSQIYMLLTMIAFFTISIYSIFKSNELECTKQDLENSKLYNQTLGLLIDNLKTFKHDYKNVLQAIGGYIFPTENIGGLKKYYSDLVKDTKEVDNLTVLNPTVINNPAVFGILASKYYLAKDKNVKINFDIFMDLSKIGMNNYKFTKILGILLDNAIEAAEESVEKLINISIRYFFNLEKQLVIIENTYKQKNIDIGKIFEKSYSTKANNTGLGLWEVKSIVEHTPNIFLDTIKDDIYFKQTLEIFCK